MPPLDSLSPEAIRIAIVTIDCASRFMNLSCRMALSDELPMGGREFSLVSPYGSVRESGRQRAGRIDRSIYTRTVRLYV